MRELVPVHQEIRQRFGQQMIMTCIGLVLTYGKVVVLYVCKILSNLLTSTLLFSYEQSRKMGAAVYRYIGHVPRAWIDTPKACF